MILRLDMSKICIARSMLEVLYLLLLLSEPQLMMKIPMKHPSQLLRKHIRESKSYLHMIIDQEKDLVKPNNSRKKGQPLEDKANKALPVKYNRDLAIRIFLNI